MNIGIVTLQYGNTATGGGGVHVNRIVDEYLKRGHFVSVFAMHTVRTENTSSMINEETLSYSIETAENLSVCRILTGKGLNTPYESKDKEEEYHRIKTFCDGVVSIIKRNSVNLDIIHMHGHHLVPGYLAFRLKDFPSKTVSTIHFMESTLRGKEGVDHINDMSEELYFDLKKWEAMTSYSDEIVVISPGQRKDFIDLIEESHDIDDIENVKDRIHLISSGVEDSSVLTEDEMRNKWGRISEKISILSYSRLDPSKGLHFAIQALPEMTRQTAVDLKLTVAGIPAMGYETTLENEKKLIGDPDNCYLQFFESIHTPDERNEFMDQFNVYLFPTLSEPFGITLIETAARGMFVMTTDSSGPMYILSDKDAVDYDWGYVTKYGINIKLTDTPQVNLKNNILRSWEWLLSNKEQAMNMILEFRKMIFEKYTWAGVVNQYISMYER
ncbi:glycosyltransferase family 4 protein [Elusimicrobiota bacterium]